MMSLFKSDDETENMLSSDKLLKSSDFADVKVSCGDRSWNLHKVVLCSRSPFFKKALLGVFEEAGTSHVILRENDPDEVDGVIEYIYTGRVSQQLLKERNTNAYVKMFELGDFFDLPGLRQKSLQLLDDRFLTDLVKDVSRHIEMESTCEERLSDVFQCHPDKLADFRHVVQSAYGDGYTELQLKTYEPIRRLVRQFVGHTFMQAARLPTFQELLREFPALAAGLFISMAEWEPELSAPLIVEPPLRCRKGRERLYSHKNAYTTVVCQQKSISVQAHVEGVCEKCA
ncbi:hypothetical protein PG993_011910 [Apiospora rasikravindrae]|uniref:BTB domain-containing protein n=1 Tax=Apiospora rasikravindrae TaxID=990691 RepID=A0ABR1S0Z3_9PEZI